MNVDSGPKAIPLHALALRLRALVLALGESVSPAWWRTEFMSETGLRFLERLYPRTVFHAAVRAAGEAACGVHDRAVGRVGVYHLFRLPESLEVEIHQMSPTGNEDFITLFRAGLGSPERLMEMMVPLCGAGEAQDVASGAKRIGTDRQLLTSDGLNRVATIYHSAFRKRTLAFPYFAAE